jgi:hypothetical protein
MSDSGRQIGDCEHGKSRDYCYECLRRDKEILFQQKQELLQQVISLEKEIEKLRKIEWQYIVDKGWIE